ncbi:glycine zipper 2TM domain-containing protein [Massilia solisilvae]|uniref:Glycine zipper 2TM domain-containing protein n=1 Tax=Massilia solisilvae TaxID=1811225 RepID=A0ABT2BK58_9BURK|nr:glycine zipper 2TM domain-containing protein [Massilia solisilvae]MCS0608897.1 glycine zipper 2TM domain-containing protein [Massilia solisilvae]
METHPIPSARNAGHHPLMILAAVAVVLFCLVGTAAVLGWLPSSIGSNSASRQLSDADRMALSAGMQQTPPTAAPLPPQPLQAAPAPQLSQQYAPQPAYPAPQYAPQPATTVPPPMPAAAPPVPVPDTAPARAHGKPARVAAVEAERGWCASCGNIESIRTITTRARGSGLGAAGGAILGGLLGNQVGSGNGRQLATVAGAVGGAVVGNQVEGNMHASQTYEIRVRLDDGTLRTFHQSSPPAWHTGERVRIVKGRLRPA